MRRNDSVWARSLGSLAIAVVATGLCAGGASAETTVHLIAAPVTKTVTLPSGATVSVPMWGYAVDSCPVPEAADCYDGVVNNSEVVTVPGPRITVPVGDTSLTVILTNRLPEPTSLVIPGLPFEAAPERNGDGRVRSMTPETAAGDTRPYAFPSVRPGTFLYQSGSHPAVQVQMGLYGALTHDAAAGQAYSAVAYDHEAILVYSEIDPALHDAVSAGTYGTPEGPTSTINYRPSLFLVNGASYTSESVAAIAAGTAGQVTLVRMLNAGLRTHVPQLANGKLKIVAEDGNKLPFGKNQAGVMLAAGKTHDALWTPAASGVYSLYDRMLALNAPRQGSAGMLAKLKIGASGAPAEGDPVAVDDSFGGIQGGPPIAGNVLANDTNAASAELVAYPHGGLLTMLAGGGFTYTPSGAFAGVDEFTYRAVNAASVRSAPALVTLTVSAVAHGPVATAQSFGVDQDGNANVTLNGTDADGDALKYYLTSLPSHGTLSFIDPITRVETPLAAAHLYPAATRKAIPAGLVIYTPAAAYVGGDTFHFVAFDGGVAAGSYSPYSSPAAVGATVHESQSAETAGLTQPVALSVVGNDGAAITNYRWTLEEDLTYKVIPGVSDPNTLAVSFHKSYMPVVAAGDQSAPPKVDPTKRYFVSVLPTENSYSNSGAEIEAGQTSVTITASKLPLPTARIRVRVFQDNAPLDGMWSADEPGLAGFQVTIDDAGGTYGMSGGHQSTDAFGNKIGTTYQPCSSSEGCTSYEVGQLGDGFVLTDADGYAVIENLVMGKYTVKVRAPGGDRWVQTTTLEGQPGIDAWVKPNEPQFFTEFGPPGPHVFVGFTRAVTGAGLLGQGPGPFSTITGRVTNLRMSRVPAVAQFSGAPFSHTRAWVALNSGATGGSLLYAQPTNEDGTFSISGVPSGSYQLMVFDTFLDLIIGSVVVNVTAPTPTNLHDVAVFSWFTNLYSFVYDDKNGDGIRQSGEPGIADQALNIRFRDGSIYQSLSTDERGFKAFNETFPFFAWMIAEVDYTRYHSTGLTVVADAGGDSTAAGSNAYNWQQQVGLPAGLIPPEVLNPQPQPDNDGAFFRTESGAGTPFLLLEGFQSFIGQSTVMMWGKAPYAPPGSIPEDINYEPFDVFDPAVASSVPCPAEAAPAACVGGFLHDIDGDANGIFDADHFNGGIAGIIHYGITRAENDPRWAVAENWDPGIADVRLELWDPTRTHLLNEGTTDNFNRDGLQPTGCQWPGDAPYRYLGHDTDCFDGLRNFNQARPAAFDGGYAFSSILVDDYDPTHPDAPMTFNNPISCEGMPVPCTPRRAMRPIPGGQYVVKTIVPSGYVLQKEEDKNVDFGDSYVPQQFWLSGYPLGDEGPSVLTKTAAPVSVSATTVTVLAGEGRNIHPGDQIIIDDEIMRITATLGDVLTVLRGQGTRAVSEHAADVDVIDFGAQLATTVNDNALIAQFCVGKLHLVPDYFTLFPGDPAPYGGEMRPLCDAKLVNLRDGQQAAPDFHFFTEAPVAGHIYGMVLDDTTNEFDPNAPTFGEKYAPPFLGVAIRDWQGREIARTYTDQYGMYNALVPTTYTINPPEPSGVSPSILQACINPPTMPGPGGTVVADPHFQKQYSHFCYPLQYLPGKTTYLDTPVVPTGAFTGNGTFPVDAELPNKTPVIALVTGPNPVATPPAPNPADPYGPYIVDRGASNNAARTIVITSAANLTEDGLTEVANPAFDGAGGLQPKLIKRDYGFGAGGTVRLGGQAIPPGNVTWGNKQITAVIPTGLRTGELSVERGDQVCTPNPAVQISTLASGATAGDSKLTVAPGGGRLFTIGNNVQIDAEVVQVTGRNGASLALVGGAMPASASTFEGRTMKVVNGQGANFTAAPFTLPTTVSIDTEAMTVTGKSSTALTLASGTGNILGMSTLTVTLGTGYGTAGSPNANRRFEVGDTVTISSIAGIEANVSITGGTSANTYNVLRPNPRFNHSPGATLTANDRFAVTRTAPVAHSALTAVVGDQLAVSRAQAGTTAASHGAGTIIYAYPPPPPTCVTTNQRRSILGITLSVATPEMHAVKPPIVVAAGTSIQAAIDAPTTKPGQLILVKPGTYEEMVVMTKPVRLQGAGALSTAINVVTAPSENVQAWLDKVGNLMLSEPSYSLPDQPAMTPAPFQPGDVAAVVGDEGPGVLVLSKNQPIMPLGMGQCISTSPLQPATNFATPANEAYCLHNENYPAGLLTGGAYYRPNARIDGFSLIGASNAPGVLVNGYAHYLEVSNNKIYTNSGTYAGGIQVGHPGAVAPFNDTDAQNEQMTIHNNVITQNAGVETGGGGGIVLGTGSNGYLVQNNFVAANLAAGNGGGIAHIGRSPGGRIDGNTVIFNESFTQAVGTSGGGIFVGGTPAAAGALTLGSGTVEVTNNLIQGNAASGGDGGGVALQGVNGADVALFGPILEGLRYRVRLYNNVIANNVAGLAGGGISMSDAAYVDITHNTVVDNDSTATAGAAFTGPLTSAPQPAGIVARGYTPPLAAVLGGGPTAHVTLANSIVWRNRTFYFGPCSLTPTTPPCGIVPVGPNSGIQYAEKVDPARTYWDLAVLGGPGQFNPVSSVISGLTNTTSYTGPGTNNTSVPPLFVAGYFNTDRRRAYQVGETNGEGTLISAPAALDEGGNFIRPQFGPLSLETAAANGVSFFGNYHLGSGSAANGASLASLYGTVPDALVTDFDRQSRPVGAPDRGADEFIAPVPTTPVPQR